MTKERIVHIDSQPRRRNGFEVYQNMTSAEPNISGENVYFVGVVANTDAELPAAIDTLGRVRRIQPNAIIVLYTPKCDEARLMFGSRVESLGATIFPIGYIK